MKRWALPEIDMDLCTGCGICAKQCQAGAVKMVDGWPSVELPQDCNYCTECEASCPEKAISCPYEIVWTESS